MTTIYALIDPRDDAVRYVGKTRSDLAHRLCAHCRARSRNNQEKDAWVRELRKTHLKPIIKPLEEVSDGKWGWREKWWIDTFKSRGAALFNKSPGAPQARDIQLNDWETLRFSLRTLAAIFLGCEPIDYREQPIPHKRHEGRLLVTAKSAAQWIGLGDASDVYRISSRHLSGNRTVGSLYSGMEVLRLGIHSLCGLCECFREVMFVTAAAAMDEHVRITGELALSPHVTTTEASKVRIVMTAWNDLIGRYERSAKTYIPHLRMPATTTASDG